MIIITTKITNTRQIFHIKLERSK